MMEKINIFNKYLQLSINQSIINPNDYQDKWKENESEVRWSPTPYWHALNGVFFSFVTCLYYIIIKDFYIFGGNNGGLIFWI